MEKLSEYINDKVKCCSKDMRMEFRETNVDIEKRIYDHVQLAIQDSRSRYDDLLRKFRAEFSETKKDMIRNVEDHVQLSILDSRSRYDNLVA